MFLHAICNKMEMTSSMFRPGLKVWWYNDIDKVMVGFKSMTNLIFVLVNIDIFLFYFILFIPTNVFPIFMLVVGNRTFLFMMHD